MHLPAVRSIDTMKISRDIAKDKLQDQSFDAEITSEIEKIANMGVTHVAIDTPYDEEFLPLLKKWVDAARKVNIKVWYRGNFSGWEGWFGYPDISRAEHLSKLKEFLNTHPELFKDGDIFTACPECENGDPNAPWQSDPSQFRKFMIDEYNAMNEIFTKQKVHIITNYNSMNGSLALHVMDKATTKAMGGVVGIDHYVSSPEQLIEDINVIAKSSGGKVVLGEIGVPIPDINGVMSEKERAEWMAAAFGKLHSVPDVIAVNYWTSWGGSTALWSKDGTPYELTTVIRNFYTGKTKPIQINDKNGDPITNASIRTFDTTIVENNNGIYQIPYLYTGQKIKITDGRYFPMENVLTDVAGTQIITLQMDENARSWLEKVIDAVKDLFRSTK
jgi:hypothetical protein